MTPAPRSAFRTIQVGTTATKILPAAPNRRGITFFSNDSQPYHLGRGSDVTVASGGMVQVGVQPFHLCKYIHGDAVENEVWAISPVAISITLIEVLE
jgi:hypothetical protein